MFQDLYYKKVLVFTLMTIYNNFSLMRKFISFLLISFFSLFPLFSIQTANASEAGIVSGFEIIAPTTAKVNEAIDITVRAIDKDKKTVTNYNGSIIFISDTFGDVVPSPGKSISFTKEDG